MNPSEKSSKNSSQQNSDRQSHSHDEANRRCLKYETAVNQVFYQIQRLRTEMLLLIDSINVHETEDPDSMLLSYQEILKKLRSKLEYHVEEILSSGNSFKMASNNFKSEEDEAATVFDGFCLDKQEISSEDHPNIIYDTRLFNGDVLDGSSTKVSESRSTKGISTCFNCFGAHVLKDCPQPKNRQKIAANLKSFRAKNAQSVTSSRYHLDESNSFKFTPGLLSPELRRAMNLGPSQLPDFVYKMRIIGYPPGWLEDAKIQDDIKLYGGDGNDEVYDTPRSPDLVTYDGSKIVDYPGFNVLPESGVFDDCHRLGYPRLQMSQLKENMPDIKYSKDEKIKTRKRKERFNETDAQRKLPKMEVKEQDMDIADGNSDDELRFATPLPMCEEIKSDVESSRNSSPTLTDLEAARKSLLLELQSDDTNSQDSGNDRSQPLPDKRNSGKSLAVECGSPWMIGTSGINKLPDAQSFADGIGEHLPFENLKNSEGTYEKMRHTISTVRRQLSK